MNLFSLIGDSDNKQQQKFEEHVIHLKLNLDQLSFLHHNV